MKILRWIKGKLGLSALEQENAALRQEIRSHRQFVVDKMAELKAYTRVDADVGMRGNNTIILTGVYRNQGYVKFYDMGDGEFMRLIEQLNDMRSHALIRHIDAPPSFKGAFRL
jgi:hypothetical protein